MLLRTFLAVSGVLILMYNVNHIPIGLANTLFNISPIFMHFIEALVNRVTFWIFIGANKKGSSHFNNSMFFWGSFDN